MVYLSDILKTSEHYETAITSDIVILLQFLFHIWIFQDIESTLAVIASIKATTYVYEKEKSNIVQANVEPRTLSKFLESIRRLKEAYNSLIDLNIFGISRYCNNLVWPSIVLHFIDLF